MASLEASSRCASMPSSSPRGNVAQGQFDDFISIKLGDIIPANARLLESDQLKIDQSVLTGESLPVNKHLGDDVFSGSICKQSEIEAIVMDTSVHIFFRKAVHLVDNNNEMLHKASSPHFMHKACDFNREFAS